MKPSFPTVLLPCLEHFKKWPLRKLTVCVAEGWGDLGVKEEEGGGK